MIQKLRSLGGWLTNGRFYLVLAAVLAVLGAKFQLIDRNGSELPYWDQWDAEGDWLLRPYVEGRLTAADFFKSHNEHRPVLTRVLSLAFFELGERQWDAKVQIVFNAFLHVAMFALIIVFAARLLPPLVAGGFTLFSVLVFSSPESWENTLSGFQSAFYFVILFTTLHIAGSLLSPIRSWRWWLAPLAGLAAIFSLASGLISAAAVLGTTLLRVLRDRKLLRTDVYLIGANLALVAVGLAMKAKVSDHESLRGEHLKVLFDAFFHQLSWPIFEAWAAPLGLIPLAAIAFAFFRRALDGPKGLTLFAASLWFLLQAAAIAYARGAENHGYGSRYSDTLGLGLLATLLTLCYLTTTASRTSTRLGWASLSVLVVLPTVLGLVRREKATFAAVLDNMPIYNGARADSVRRYLANQDPVFFTRTPWTELPYPDPRRLAELLDNPSLRSTLPPSAWGRTDILAVPTATAGILPYVGTLGTGPAPEGLQAWLSPGKEKAQFTSKPFVIRRSEVRLYVASQQASHFELSLVDEKGVEFAPLAIPPPRPTWQPVRFKVHPGRYELRFRHQGPGWLVFSGTSNTTSLSLLAGRLVSFAHEFLYLGIASGAIALGLLWHRQNAEKQGVTDKT